MGRRGLKRRREEGREVRGVSATACCPFSNPQSHLQLAYHPLYLPPAYSNTPYNCPFPPSIFLSTPPLVLHLFLLSLVLSSLSLLLLLLSFLTHTFSFLSTPGGSVNTLDKLRLEAKGEERKREEREETGEFYKLEGSRGEVTAAVRVPRPTEVSHRGAIITRVKTSFSLCLTGAVF